MAKFPNRTTTTTATATATTTKTANYDDDGDDKDDDDATFFDPDDAGDESHCNVAKPPQPRMLHFSHGAKQFATANVS